MSGSFYALAVNPQRRQLVFSMGLGSRLALGLVWLSLTLALAPALVPGTGIQIDGDGWLPAGLFWALATLGLGWRDRWVFDAGGQFHRERGWLVFYHRRTRDLAGFGGWVVETHAVRALDPAGRRGSLGFQTAQGRWRLDSRFRAAWLEQQGAVLDLWTSWYREGKSHEA